MPKVNKPRKTSHSSSIILFLNLSICLFHFACQSNAGKETTATHPVMEEEAQGHFHIERKEGYSIVKVNNPYVGSDLEEQYVLYNKALPPPELDSITHFISVPVESVSISSTTHLGYIESIAALDKIKAATGLNLYYSKAFQEKVKNRSIHSLGESGLNHEQLINIAPEVHFSYAVDISDMKEIERLRELGQNVIVIPEYMERNPLMKAAWIQVFALFFEKEYQARGDSLFNTIKQNYNKVRNEAALYSFRPSIMIGYPWKGTWYVSGGNSYQAKLIMDANAGYIWHDREQVGGVPLSEEQVLNDALNADFWINCGDVKALKDIAVDYPLLTGFKPYKTQSIYQNYKRSNEKGANDYWETGVVRPDLILKDLVTIFHKKDEEEDELYFYQKLAP